VNSRALVVGVLIGSMLLSPGCVKKYVAKVAPFVRGKDDLVLKAAPRSGVYNVQFVEDDHFIKDAGAAPAVYVQKGDPIGFRQAEDGKIIGVAGVKEYDVVGMPSRATHVMWYHKSKQPTQFAKSMGKTGEAMQTVLITGAVGAGLVAAGAFAFWAEVHDDDDCVDYGPRNYKRNHEYR